MTTEIKIAVIGETGASIIEELAKLASDHNIEVVVAHDPDEAVDMLWENTDTAKLDLSLFEQDYLHSAPVDFKPPKYVNGVRNKVWV